MTTPEQHQKKSAAPGEAGGTGFKDKLGRDIPAEAFENDAGPPRAPAMSEADLAKFDAETARLKQQAGRAK